MGLLITKQLSRDFNHYSQIKLIRTNTDDLYELIKRYEISILDHNKNV